MNRLLLALVALVAFTYFGGQNVPKVLKDNKQMLLGVFVGVLLQQFMGVEGVQGLKVSDFNIDLVSPGSLVGHGGSSYGRSGPPRDPNDHFA